MSEQRPKRMIAWWDRLPPEQREKFQAQHEKHLEVKRKLKQKTNEELQMPTLTEMAKNLAQSAKEEIKAISENKPNIQEDEIKRRLDICATCEFFVQKSQRCSKCGCKLRFKRRLRSAHCPVGKW